MKMFYWVALLTLGLTAATAAQVPVTKEPRHRVAFENAELRILDVNVPPGDTTLDHLHDRDIVTVSMNDGTDTRLQSVKLAPPLTHHRPRPPNGAPGLRARDERPARPRRSTDRSRPAAPA